MKYFLVVVGFVVSTAYAGEPTKLIDDKNMQRREELNFNKVIFVDHKLNRIILNEKNKTTHQTLKVSLQKYGARLSQTNSLEVYTILKNHTDYDQQVEARTIFFDAAQTPLDDTSAWTRMYIPANSFGTYREYSVSPDAKYYVVEIREGK